jgi:aminobenzoyl-glutamate transport protein
LTETAKTLTGFAPLGVVLTVMYGAAVAERSGFFSALIRASLRGADRRWLTPLVALIGMVSHHASDAAYLVFIPLAALLYAAVGRHPLAGLAAAFAAVSGGYAGNITPGQIDIVLFSFTQEAARIIDPSWTLNPLGNWWFILAVVGIFTPLIWFVTDRIIEPRLGPWQGEPDADLTAELARSAPSEAERRGLRRAGLAALAVAAGFAALALWPRLVAQPVATRRHGQRDGLCLAQRAVLAALAQRLPLAHALPRGLGHCARRLGERLALAQREPLCLAQRAVLAAHHQRQRAALAQRQRAAL